MTPDLQSFMQTFSIWFIPGIFAITVHEVAHGWVAFKYGDPTAFLLGRLTINPFKHIDPVGTVAVPLSMLFLNMPFLFGWAKPVPVNPRYIKKPRFQLAIIALAGPVANILMAFFWAIMLRGAIFWNLNYGHTASIWLAQTSKIGVFFNIILAVFNLLPIPPLDGGKVIQAILPYSLSLKYGELEPYGFILLITLLVLNILPPIIAPPIYFAYTLLMP